MNNTIKTKKCTTCGEVKSLTDYHSNYTYCRPCKALVNAEYKSKNREKIARSNNKYINTEKGYTKETVDAIFQRARKIKAIRLVKNGFLNALEKIFWLS